VPPIPNGSDSSPASQHVEHPAGQAIDSSTPPEPPNVRNDALLQTDKPVNLPSSGNSPEPHQTDMEGHYVGPASGVSFLIRVQKRLHENISFPRTSPIFSFGDAPLPKYDPSFLVIPSKDDAKALLERYFDFAFPTHRFLHQPQAEGWLDDFYRDPGEAQSPRPGAMAIRALLLMIFAHAKQCLPESESSLGSCVNRFVPQTQQPAISCLHSANISTLQQCCLFRGFRASSCCGNRACPPHERAGTIGSVLLPIGTFSNQSLLELVRNHSTTCYSHRLASWTAARAYSRWGLC
jgi:hypothetical protein